DRLRERVGGADVRDQYRLRGLDTDPTARLEILGSQADQDLEVVANLLDACLGLGHSLSADLVRRDRGQLHQREKIGRRSDRNCGAHAAIEKSVRTLPVGAGSSTWRVLSSQVRPKCAGVLTVDHPSVSTLTSAVQTRWSTRAPTASA